nr:type II toxin-antitoxin system VapC family toxin [Metallosphaera tengchongensis]
MTGDSLSVISMIEIGRALDDEKRMKTFEKLKEMYTVYPIDENVALEYCWLYYELKKKGQLMSDLDLIIASTVKAYDQKLVTKDKDFLKVGSYIDVEII